MVKKLKSMVNIIGGISQLRIKETEDKNSSKYLIYSQVDLQNDFNVYDLYESSEKFIQTQDEVTCFKKGDIVFGLISGIAAIVGEGRDGYCYTQNYVKIEPLKINSEFLVYYLNENKSIRKQLSIGVQGTSVKKYTLQQLNELEVDRLPNSEKQKIIGDIYIKSRRLETLKNKVSKDELKVAIHKLNLEIIEK